MPVKIKFKVNGVEARNIIRNHGYNFYYDHETVKNLYIRGSDKFPIHSGINTTNCWWWCNSQYSKFDEQIKDDGWYEFEVEGKYGDCEKDVKKSFKELKKGK